MQFLIPLKKKYNIISSPIKTSLIEHFKGEAVEARTHARRANTPTEGCTCTACTNVYQQTARAEPEPSGSDPAAHQRKGLIIKVTNDYTGFIAFSGIICMNFTSLLNNPFTDINKTEIG